MEYKVWPHCFRRIPIQYWRWEALDDNETKRSHGMVRQWIQNHQNFFKITFISQSKRIPTELESGRPMAWAWGSSKLNSVWRKQMGWSYKSSYYFELSAWRSVGFYPIGTIKTKLIKRIARKRKIKKSCRIRKVEKYSTITKSLGSN